MIETKFIEFSEPAEYYIMPRVRFHSSLDRDDLMNMVKEQMTRLRPDCKLNWKQTDIVIFVEVLKRNCYLSIFKDWNARQKYNWQEYHKRMTKVEIEKSETEKSDASKPEIEKSEVEKSVKPEISPVE